MSIKLLMSLEVDTLKNNIKDLRTKRCVSQAALAEAVGTTRKTIYAIETGNQDIRISLAHKLAVYLGCSIDDLYDFNDGSHSTVDKALWFANIVRNLAEEMNISTKEATKLLVKTGLARGIISGYDVWHTQGYEYMTEFLAGELSKQGA